MPVHYVVRPRKNPQDPKAAEKFYLIAKSLSPVTRKTLIDDMVRNTSLTKHEAATGIDYLFESLPRYLELGHSVQLGELGYFRVTVTSKGSETLKEATPEKIIKKKLHFIFGKEIRNHINKIGVEKFPEI
ncbi:HU family DNA-binding protein [Bacteroidales bacterium OttesenSCG-928-M06]|nr:HU family DNA-binding protein [Bacteroidales bacterium OttesenSCG-928-M06]